MASPKTLHPEDAISCNDTECRRPAVYSAEVCRLHLADVLRREGEDISFPHPEWDGSGPRWFILCGRPSRRYRRKPSMGTDQGWTSTSTR